MPDPIQLVPLDAILADALVRDRAAHDPAALDELRSSILASGLRMPIEVFELAEPVAGRAYGLISGFRRLAAFRAIAAGGLPGHAAIPAFLRSPASIVEAMTAMVEENAIRAEVSPWEQALIAVTAAERELFPTLDAAIDVLFASLERNKRHRLRSIARLVQELNGTLTAPERLSLRQLLRLAAAAARGYGEVMHHALLHSSDRTPETQWRLLESILAECEDPAIPDPRPELGDRDRPRRTWQAPARRIWVRRERTRDGWSLHFTGRDAQIGLIQDVLEEVERMFGRG